MINVPKNVTLEKLDVLDELEEIKMCIKYELNGKKIDYLPATSEDQYKIKPIEQLSYNPTEP